MDKIQAQNIRSLKAKSKRSFKWERAGHHVSVPQKQISLFVFSFSLYHCRPGVVWGILHCPAKGTQHTVWELFHCTNTRSLFMLFLVFGQELYSTLLLLSHFFLPFSSFSSGVPQKYIIQIFNLASLALIFKYCFGNYEHLFSLPKEDWCHLFSATLEFIFTTAKWEEANHNE